jgi:sterol desaturase/sphingolipid hydroxylase (fatty acid hydroxylase superfamily)
MKHPFFEQYKVNNEPWPWEENKEEWNKFLKKSIGVVSINLFITLPFLVFLQGAVSNGDYELSFEYEDLPTTFTLLWQVMFCFLLEDFSFHLSHRLLHSKHFYGRFHKQHHEYKVTVSLAAEHSHPVEYIFASAIPSTLGLRILSRRVHFITYACWIIIRLAETADGHSGYEFPWSPFRILPMTTSATYHDFHHLKNIGNYSSVFRTWDTIFG